jgi:hypothetical protein
MSPAAFQLLDLLAAEIAEGFLSPIETPPIIAAKAGTHASSALQPLLRVHGRPRHACQVLRGTVMTDMSPAGPESKSLPQRLVEYLEATREDAVRRVRKARRDSDDDAPPRELELIELGGLLEMQLDKPRELVGSLVREASVGMTHAPAGAGKTFFALGMAVALTHGAPFLGFQVKEPFSAL